MEAIIRVTALALIALMFISVMMGQKKAAREGFADVITSEIPDVCAALMEDDCNKTKGCQFSRDVGLCVRRHTIEDKTAQAVLVRDIVEKFDNEIQETGPVPYNGLI
jgi:hypothetical protein